jgi:hypothetical protein
MRLRTSEITRRHFVGSSAVVLGGLALGRVPEAIAAEPTTGLTAARLAAAASIIDSVGNLPGSEINPAQTDLALARIEDAYFKSTDDARRVIEAALDSIETVQADEDGISAALRTDRGRFSRMERHDRQRLLKRKARVERIQLRTGSDVAEESRREPDKVGARARKRDWASSVPVYDPRENSHLAGDRGRTSGAPDPPPLHRDDLIRLAVGISTAPFAPNPTETLTHWTMTAFPFDPADAVS